MRKNFELDSVLNAHHIQKLYISLDYSGMKERWEEVIDIYNLGGWHVLANERLRRELNSLLILDGAMVRIPRYLMLKNGKIILRNAPSPNDINELIKLVQGDL